MIEGSVAAGPQGSCMTVDGRWWCGTCNDQLETAEERILGICEICEETQKQIALEKSQDSVTLPPERIQLRRTKGWRMPPNTVKVDRSTKWGNPFVIGQPGGAFAGIVKDRRHAYLLFLGAAPGNETLVAAAQSELRGRNLACWCPRDDPYEDVCHAAVLLKIANEREPGGGN